MNNVQVRSNRNYNFYTSNGWAGKNYDRNLKGKDIAAKVRAFVKNEFPDFKFSIRSKFGMQADTIYITVLSGPIPALCEGNTRSYESCISGFGDAYKGRITDEMLAVLDKVHSFVSSFRYSDCDGMIDYFDTNFYCWMYIGDYDRPYQITEKKERNNNQANNPNQSEEVKPVESVSGFEIVEYSEKSIAVFGDTKSIKDELKALGGKFNPALKYDGEKRTGWIFPKKQADKVRALLAPASCVCSETSPVLADQEEKKESEIMDQKSINQEILDQLYVIGQEIFEKYVQIDKEGSYTALHLHNEKNAMGEPIRVSFSENPEYTVQVGPFRCKFPANFVFKLINRFEKLNNMGNKKMKVFTYGENPAEIVSAPCVYLDLAKEFKTGKKKIKKITDSLALLRMAGGRFRVMYHISGTWYQIYDCINGGSDFAERLAIKYADNLASNPDYYKELIFAYECCGGAYDQIIVAMRAAYVDSETSQTLEQEEEEVKPVVEHYFVKKKTDLEQLIESGDLDSINEMIKQKEEALNNAIENVNYYKEINNIEFMENEEVRAGRLQRDLELLKTAIKETSNTKNMDSPAYGDSETSQIRTNDSGLVRGQKIYAIGANNTKQIYAVLDPENRTCVEVGDPNNINEWVLERYFRPLQRFRPNIQPASNRNGIGFYYAENEPIYSEMDLKRFCERADKIEAMKKNLEEEKRIQSEKNKADLLDKYPYLKRPEYPCDYKSIMYNLRSVLKHEFPDTSFSVRRDSRDNAIIRWEDGPDEKDVLRVASLFEGKTFHAETDYEDFVYTDFISLFGSLGYIFTERTETEIIEPETEIIQQETETIQPETETIRQETEIKGNRFYTDIREDYAPFHYVVVDRLDGSVWFFTDSEDEAKDWAADYNQEYSDGGKQKKQPDVEHEVIRTDLAKCAG